MAGGDCILMKQLNIRLTDREYYKLKKAKNLSSYSDRTWRIYILHELTKGVSIYKELKKEVKA